MPGVRRLAVLIMLVLGAGVLSAWTTSPTGAAPPDPADYWTSSSRKADGDRRGSPPRVRPDEYAGFTLDRDALVERLARVPMEGSRAAAQAIWVPAPTGDLVAFEVSESPVMESELAARHPELRTYAGRGVEDPTATIRLDVTPMGFHASVRGSGEQAAWFVDPARNGDDSLYLSYLGSSLPAPERGLVEPELDESTLRAIGQDAGEAPGAEVRLRTYRLALMTDPSYAAYFGTENVLAEKVTLMNRVNHIYNDDLAIRMVLINDTEKLNFDTAAEATEPGGPCGAAACFTTDHLSSCTSGALNRNRIVLGQVVGASSYDIGHLALGNPGGGVAQLGAVGRSGKARGCTGLPTPEGDYFAVDYVAHEMGHQFGGPHTFNGTEYNCSGNRGGSPWEPGSGTSVMAYAGICQQDNLQPHSDPYFSQRSITDITSFVLAALAAENEVQTVSLRDFDSDGESFTLSFNGQPTQPIVRGATTYTIAAIDAAIEAVTGVGSVDVAAWGGGQGAALDDAGFQVTFVGGALAGTDVPSIGLAPTDGDVTGFVGETSQGGPVANGGQTVTLSGNRAPVATAPAAKTIPIRTPFALTGSGTDADGDPLVYIWEQNDRGGPAGTTLGSQVKPDGPLFRVFGAYAPVTPAGTLEINSPGENLASSNPTRVFPDLAQIADNNTNAATGTCPAMPAKPATGGASNVPVPVVECFAEWLPTTDYVGSVQGGNVEPSLNFRFTARDLDPTGGGYAYGDVRLTLDQAAGPFLVSSKNAAGATAVGGRTETLTWAVAGTDTPALAENVRISLSDDGGQTFPYMLAESTPNDGSAQVTWPNLDTTTARLKIEAVGNYFFDINDADITIVPALSVTGPSPAAVSVQQGTALAPVEVSASTRGADGDSLTATASGLPAGVTISTASTSADHVRPGTATWRVGGTVTSPPGTYSGSISISDGSETVTTPLTVTVTVPPPDGSVPDTSITSRSARGGIALTTPVVLDFASTESGVTYVCSLDGAALPCETGRATIDDPSAGDHELTVAARDATGNVDATPATHRFTVPVDDTDLKARGRWKRASAAGAYGGDYSQSTRKGARLTFRVEDVRAVWLVVSTRKNSGPLDVYLGKRLLRTVQPSGPADTMVLRKVSTFGGDRTGTIRIVNAKNRTVRVEGLAVVSGPG